jgi:MFS transporter, DHA2 family, multidrug resistance protein
MTSTLAASEPHSRRGRPSPWWGLAVLALPTLLTAIDMNVLFLALPALTRDLAASATEQLWISDVYGFLLAGCVLTMGTLGDRVGRRRLLFAGSAAFAVISVLAAFSTTPAVLIAARALLGVAGATLVPATLALVTALFPAGESRNRAIAVWATCQFGGAALGPVVGGLLLEHLWWGSVFLLAVPVAVVVLTAGPFVLPAARGSGRDAGSLDPVSVGLSLLALLPLVHALQSVAGHEPVGITAGAAALGMTGAVLFVRRQRRLERPLLDLGLLRVPRVRVVLGALVGAGTAMAGVALLVTQYLQVVLGLSPLAAALWFAPMGLGVAAGTLLTSVLVRRVPEAVAVPAGLGLSAVGAFLLLATPPERGGPVALAVVAVTVLALGTGPLFALGFGQVVGAAPAGRAGSAASLAEVGNHLGAALGVAALGTIAAAVSRAALHGAGGPAPQVATAHEAFTSGLHVVGAVAGLLFVLLALVTARGRRESS